MKRFFVFFASVFIFASCQQELLESPSFRTLGSYTTGEIEPPTNVKASQGNYRSITLTWNAAKHATYYNIYESDTKTGKFIKISESTDGSCTYTMQNDPDTQKFYRITSVDSEKNESFPSETIYGTTLATPIITSITQGAGGSSVKVKWYKGITCNEDTYLSSNLIYHVYLLDESRSKTINEAIFPADTLGNKYECVFDKLEAKTNYTIRIDSYLLSDVNHPEISDIIDASTAHSLIPSAPQEFTVSKGTSDGNVTLKWKLPNFAEIYQSGYESRPVYFIIWRKEKGESDKKYQKIVPYIGQFNDSKNAKDSVATGAIKFGYDADGNFESTIGGSDCEYLTCVKAPDEDAEKIPSYPGYIPTTVLAYTDTDVVRGKQYTYKIQSVVDGNGTVIRTDDDCCVEDDGWAISTGIGSISSDVKYADENTISSIDVKIKLNFEDFDQDYKYVIKEYKSYKDSEEDTTETVKRQGARENVFSEKFSYVPDDDEEGKSKIYICTYKIEIFDISSDALITTIEVGGSVYVLKNVSDVPKVEDFEVYDGYSDKFVLKWTYIKDAEYILEWIENSEKKQCEIQIPDNKIDVYKTEDYIIKDGKIRIITENENTESEKTYVKFNHTANSGDKRSNYILYAIVGLQSQKEPTNGPFEDGHEFKTLGTPILEFEGGNYKEIKVEWESVQMAKESAAYTVSAHYKDVAHSTLELIPSTPAYDGNTGKWYSEITELKMEREGEGGKKFIDPTISGLPIEFKVTAVSSVDGVGTTATTEVSTLGPAGMDVKVVDSDKDKKNTQIKLRFKKPPKGTKGILIFRTIGGYTHTYYVDLNAESERVKVVDKNISKTLSNIITATDFSGNEWYFTDIYKDIKDDIYKEYEECNDELNKSYCINQAKIKWGLPCVYTVIPVLNESDYTCIETSTEIKNKENVSVAYEKLKSVTGATPGYGQNITATKATSDQTVTITWEKPFGANGSPILYYRDYNAGKNSPWNRFNGSVSGISLTVTSALMKEDLAEPRDFMVIYNEETSVDSLYEDEIDENKEVVVSDGVNVIKEKKNKGYLFTLDKDMLNAEYDGTMVKDGRYDTTNVNYYSERIILKGFDYKKRAAGPTSIELQMLNLDKKDWVKIADIYADPFNDDNNGTVDELVDELVSDHDLYVKDESNLLRLMPKSFINDDSDDLKLVDKPTSTNGLLKVLRDYKHYYKLVVKREYDDGDGVKTISLELGADRSIYAYRQITDEEFCKCITLIVADAIYQTGINSTGNGKNCTGNIGSFHVEHTGGTQKAVWGTNSGDYVHIFRGGTPYLKGVAFISDFKINMKDDNKTQKASAYGNTLYWLDNTTEKPITVSHSSGLESYKGTIQWSAGGRVNSSTVGLFWNLQIYKDKSDENPNAVINFPNTKKNDTSTKDNFLRYFPYDIGTSHSDGITKYNTSAIVYSKAYGWWDE